MGTGQRQLIAFLSAPCLVIDGLQVLLAGFIRRLFISQDSFVRKTVEIPFFDSHLI